MRACELEASVGGGSGSHSVIVERRSTGSALSPWYELLGSAGMPTFYDKLLQVPLSNRAIQLFDRTARFQAPRLFHLFGARPIARAAPASPGQYYVDLGHRVCGHERGAGSGRQPSRGWRPFWRQACEEFGAVVADALSLALSSSLRRGRCVSRSPEIALEGDADWCATS